MSNIYSNCSILWGKKSLNLENAGYRSVYCTQLWITIEKHVLDFTDYELRYTYYSTFPSGLQDFLQY